MFSLPAKHDPIHLRSVAASNASLSVSDIELRYANVQNKQQTDDERRRAIELTHSLLLGQCGKQPAAAARQMNGWII